MPFDLTLVESSQYRIRYLAIVPAVPLAPNVGIVPNRPPTGTGLRTDTRSSFRGSALNQLVSTPVTNQTDARRLFNGDGLTARLDLEIPRGHLRVSPLTSTIVLKMDWAIDADEGSILDPQSAGFAIIVVRSPGVQGQMAYVDLYYSHTFQR